MYKTTKTAGFRNIIKILAYRNEYCKISSNVLYENVING